jgi:hypothetical protein
LIDLSGVAGENEEQGEQFDGEEHGPEKRDEEAEEEG